VAKPFETLDKLYYNILSTAKGTYEGVDTHHGRDFLLLCRALQMGSTGSGFDLGHLGAGGVQRSTAVLSALLCLEAQAEEALISDLRSLVALDTDRDLHLYHKSFSDFLQEPSRAKDLFVPESRVYTHLAKCLMQNINNFRLDINSCA
jgi:hypothetical protein